MTGQAINAHAEGPEEPSDRELVARAQSDDAEAYNELVRRNHGRVYGLLYNLTSNKEDAEDLAQDVFYRAYRAIKRFKGDSAFSTWIYRIAMNRGFSFLKSRKRRSMVMGMSLDDMDGGVERDPAYVELSAQSTPFRDATLNEVQEKMNIALQKLSEKHRNAVIMHDIQGLQHDEIAEILGTTSGTVRSRLFYARKILQKELAEYAP
ncbi:MAG: sigma-70 family RNA polymerase sigma factor [Kiritimatiellia bacterium]